MNYAFLEILTWLGFVIGAAGLILIVFSVAVSVADEAGVLENTDGPFRPAHP